jgi:TnpA family transposase
MRQVGSPDKAWDQNLMTEWHPRYRGPGVLIYWHVERKSTGCVAKMKGVMINSAL